MCDEGFKEVEVGPGVTRIIFQRSAMDRLMDPRPPKRIKDTDALKRFRLEMVGEPCELCELRTGDHAHHVRFRSQGGDDARENLLWLRPLRPLP